jgi:hypothetical protein
MKNGNERKKRKKERERERERMSHLGKRRDGEEFLDGSLLRLHPHQERSELLQCFCNLCIEKRDKEAKERKEKERKR